MKRRIQNQRGFSILTFRRFINEAVLHAKLIILHCLDEKKKKKEEQICITLIFLASNFLRSAIIDMLLVLLLTSILAAELDRLPPLTVNACIITAPKSQVGT